MTILSRRMYEPGTEFHEKDAWQLRYTWEVCGHGFKVIKLRYVHENVEKRSSSIRRMFSWTWWLELSGHLHYSILLSPFTRPIAMLESVIMPKRRLICTINNKC